MKKILNTTKKTMTIDRLTSGAGIIDNLFSQDELVEVVKYMSKLPKNYTSDDGNSFAAISENHMLYSWFCKKIFNKIKELTPVDIRLIFGSYLDEKTPWGVHSDYYHHQSVSNPYMAFLIPLSVDNDMSHVGRTNTVIFNEEDAYTDNENSIKHWSDKLWKKNRSLKENNAVSLGSGLLNHVSVENLECLTINTIANWKLGSVIYWNEKYLHCSDDFVKNNVTSKQALVIHTYVV